MRTIYRKAAMLLALTPGIAFGHVSFETPDVVQNSSYKAVIRIDHGCSGSPTQSLKVDIPEGFVAARPMPKPGWTLQATRGAYAQTYDYFGTPLSEGVKTITWAGGNLADTEYDEFVFVARVTDRLVPGNHYFPVTQTRATGAHAWVEVPASGQDDRSLKSPAPSVTVKLAEKAESAKPAPVPSQTASVLISGPWSRATPAGARVAGGYFTIENRSTSPDRLIGGNFAVAKTFEVHEMSVSNGVMTMRTLEKGLEIPAQGKVELKPGSYHAMLIELSQPLKAGESISGELLFEKAGRIPVTLQIMPIGSPGPQSHH